MVAIALSVVLFIVGFAMGLGFVVHAAKTGGLRRVRRSPNPAGGPHG